MTLETTLLDLVTAVNEVAATEDEAIATIVHLVNSGLAIRRIVQTEHSFRYPVLLRHPYVTKQPWHPHESDLI